MVSEMRRPWWHPATDKNARHTNTTPAQHKKQHVENNIHGSDTAAAPYQQCSYKNTKNIKRKNYKLILCVSSDLWCIISRLTQREQTRSRTRWAGERVSIEVAGKQETLTGGKWRWWQDSCSYTATTTTLISVFRVVWTADVNFQIYKPKNSHHGSNNNNMIHKQRMWYKMRCRYTTHTFSHSA